MVIGFFIYIVQKTSMQTVDLFTYKLKRNRVICKYILSEKKS